MTTGQGATIGLYAQTGDPLPGRSRRAEEAKILEGISYRDYLIKRCGVGEEVADCFQGRTLDFFALGCDAGAGRDAKPDIQASPA